MGGGSGERRRTGGGEEQMWGKRGLEIGVDTGT